MDGEKWIEIARTGTFTDSAGRPQTFTQGDLDAIATAYDPEKRDAPLVFGHPKSDAAPAYGWVQKLKSEGAKLFALFAHVPGEVKALVAKKHYRHVSMSLMPDRVTLRHVALLGAAQPAIDGLQAVDLTDGGDAICVEFAEAVATENDDKGDDRMTVEELQRQVGQLQAQLDAAHKENADLKKKLDDASGAKDSAEAAKTDAEKQAESVAAEFSAYKGKIETEHRAARVAALVKAGKVKPAEQAGILSFAAKLAETPGTLDFAAPDGKRETLTVEEHYLRELEARPVDDRFTADFSAPPAHGGHAGNFAPAFDPAKMAAKM